jgi:energy-coupling factor transport system substrate-specific component
MAAWGLVGVFGAVLRKVFGRELGRWSLAFACLISGFMFGLIMDFYSWATYSGQHTLAQFGAVCVTSLPFNIAHAAGNFVFCLAFGPAFVRTLARFRTRLTIRWQPRPTNPTELEPT